VLSARKWQNPQNSPTTINNNQEALVMRKQIPAFTAFTAIFLALISIGFISGAQQFEYPNTKKVDQIDSYHGTKVADPYRWLEDDNSAERLNGWRNRTR
jgi:hypothetical protein